MSFYDEIIANAIAKQNSEYGIYNEGDYYKEYNGYKILYCKQCNEPKQTIPFRSLYSSEEIRELEEKYAMEHKTLTFDEVHKEILNIVPPKSKRIDFDLVGVPCKCQRDYSEDVNKAENLKKRQARIKANQVNCFPAPKMRNVTFDKYQDNKHIRATKKYEEMFKGMCSDGKGLVLCGKSGAGKTIAAICLANALLQREFTVLFKIQQEITLCDINGRKKMCDSFINCSVLIIDDLNLDTCTDYGNELLFYIIDGRVKNGKPTIITTNHTKQAILNAADLNKRLFSRIVESSYIVEDSTNNYRKVKNEIDTK